MRSRSLLVGLAVVCLAPPLWAGPAPRKKAPAPQQVPYRLTDTQHILVRAKINGKGPFNFILDTGAPAVFVSTAVGKKLGLGADKKGWAVLDRFDLEGGVSQEKVKVRLETLFQLEGMNALGFAGVELHGVIGYTFLARYRVEIDLTKDRLAWTKLDFEPPPVVPLGKGAKSPGGLDALGGFVRLLAAVVGKRPAPEVVVRGFFGLELEDRDGGVTVRSVLAKGPADAAGLKTGYRITAVDGKEVKTAADVHRRTARVAVGESVRLTVQRPDGRKEITLTAGEGL